MTVMERPRRGGRTGFLAKAVLSAVLLGWLVSRADLHEVSEGLRQAHLPLLALAFFQFLVGYLISASRWKILLRAQGIHLGLGYLIKSFAVAVFFNNFLPSTVGGDVSRVYDTWRAGASRVNALAAVFLDRLVGLLALAMFAAVGLVLGGGFGERTGILPWVVWIFLGATASAVFLVFFFPPDMLTRARRAMGRMPGPARRMAGRFLDAVALFRGRVSILLYGLGLSLLLQGNVILFYFLVGRALDLPLGFLDQALIVPLALVVMLIPVSVNGLGLREGVFAFFFGFYGLELAQALAFSWVIYGQILLQGLLGGLVYLLRDRSRPGQDTATGTAFEHRGRANGQTPGPGS